MQAIAAPITPPKATASMFQQPRIQSSTKVGLIPRPLSHATDTFDTDFEDESDFEEYSPKGSFESEDGRRRSQTTISSYDEATTPHSTYSRRPIEFRSKPVAGPKGPHLFRSSQASAEFAYDYALQMSPLLPKEPPLRTQTGFSEATVTPITQLPDSDFSIATALSQAMADNDSETIIRGWSTQDVVDWMCASGIDATVIECLELNDINGAVLLDLHFEDLKELGIQSFGKRHQLWSAVSLLRGEESTNDISPQQTPFEDTSRPCTRSPSRTRVQWSIDDDTAPKKRRGRKAPRNLDVITPAESVSIVAIEQLIPRPHKCTKGDRCAKWRKQQRELEQLHDDNGIGRFPISPTNGGRIHVIGDPGNAATAANLIPNVRRQLDDDPFRPQSEAMPSVVASSDLLGPGLLPDFALHADMLDQVDKRDPLDNVRQFLNFQHLQSPGVPQDDYPLTPLAVESSPPRFAQDPISRSESVPTLFPAEHHQAYPSLFANPHHQLRTLPRLDIPQTVSGDLNMSSIQSAASLCRSATASPGNVYRFGTPASEMDVPVTAVALGPVSRDVSQSVPPNMQYRQQSRSSSRTACHDWRRPSLPAVKEGEVLSASASNPRMPRPSISSHTSANSIEKVRDPAHHSPETKNFGYGPDCSHAGWMKKRKTKMLRHEWNDAHCRLKGTQLGLHANSRLSTIAHNVIDTENYAVACSSVASTNKLSAAMKVFQNKSQTSKDLTDPTAFAFQLVPSRPEAGEKKPLPLGGGKTHHFAVTSKDERIDWMRELMLAKALQQKGKGYEVEINGVQA